MLLLIYDINSRMAGYLDSHITRISTESGLILLSWFSNVEKRLSVVSRLLVGSVVSSTSTNFSSRVSSSIGSRQESGKIDNCSA